MDHIIRTLLVLLILSHVNDGLSQQNMEFSGKYPDYPYKENKVLQVTEYLMYPSDTTNHILKRRESFNEEGFVLERISYSENGEANSRSVFRYENDTLLVVCEDESYKSNRHDRTEYKYNRQNQLTESISKNGDKVISKRKYKWNKKGTKLKVINNLGDFKIKKEILFDNQGRMTSIQLKSKSKRSKSIEYQTIEYLENDLVVTKVYFVKGSDNYVLFEKVKNHNVKVKNKSSETWYDLDFGQGLKMEQGDEVEKISHYFENGLLSVKERYINDKLESTVRYEYEFYD